MLWAVVESWVNVPQFYNLTRNVVLMLSQLLRRFMVAIQLEYGSKCYKISACVRPIDPTRRTRSYLMCYKYELGSFKKNVSSLQEVKGIKSCSTDVTVKDSRQTTISQRKLGLFPFLRRSLCSQIDSTELIEVEFLSQDSSLASPLMQQALNPI